MNLTVTDMSRSSEFYQRYLDFAELDWHQNMVVLQDEGGLDLVLEAGAPNPGNWHFGFRLADADQAEQARAELKAAGLVIFDEEDINGMLTFKFRDPDGYILEIYSYG